MTRGIISPDPTSPVYFKALMLMRISAGVPIFKHRDTRYYLAADGTHFYRWDNGNILMPDEHHALLAQLLTERARLHGLRTIVPELQYLVGTGQRDSAVVNAFAPGTLAIEDAP